MTFAASCSIGIAAARPPVTSIAHASRTRSIGRGCPFPRRQSIDRARDPLEAVAVCRDQSRGSPCDEIGLASEVHVQGLESLGGGQQQWKCLVVEPRREGDLSLREHGSRTLELVLCVSLGDVGQPACGIEVSGVQRRVCGGYCAVGASRRVQGEC
jgi:hypothetical protein